jgi:glucose-6-phosphate 1-dehydrogenase
VQNLMALRFANALYEPLWNSAHIDHVQITVAETVGLEGRAGYYDKAGALRDMVQNHILQLLCLVAMEAAVLDGRRWRARREAEGAEGAEAASMARPASDRARPVPRRRSSGGAVKGYLEDLGNGASDTETFVAIKAEIANWRWAGVPFYLRTGKRLAERVSEIVIEFKPIPHSIFGEAAGPGRGQPARHPAAARRGRQAVDHDQGSRPRRHAAAPRAARHELCAGLRRAQSGCL